MNGIAGLPAEIVRWEEDLAVLEDECAAEGWTEPEKLLFTVQRTVATYRQKVLPRIAADRAVMLLDGEPRALTAYAEIVADEIAQLVDRLDELRIELIRFGQTGQSQLQATETLAGLRALGRVVLRFGQEVELPSLTARLTR
jgi:hypothetical protein